MTMIAKDENQYNALWNEYMGKYNAYIYESNELFTSIMYGKTGQYNITIVRPR